MKTKIFLPIILFCIPLLFTGANNLKVVNAESTTESINLFNYVDSSISLSDEMEHFNSKNENVDPVFSGGYLKLYSGSYIQTKMAKTVEGGTTITFNLQTKSNGTHATSTHGLYAYVYNENGDKIAERYNNAKTAPTKISIDIAETGNYYFRISSKSGSTSSKFTRIYYADSMNNGSNLSNITYTPHVEQTEENISSDKFSSEKTLSQMAFSFSKTIVDENVDYSLNEVVLRYGAKIDYESTWSSLNVKSYGVAVAKTNDLNGETLTSLLANKDLSDSTITSGFENIKFAIGDVENVTRVTQTNDTFTEDENGSLVLFNARIVVPKTNYDTSINAVAYVVFEEDGINKVSFFEEVLNDSVATQANYYLENGEYNEDVTNVLRLLAN